MNFVCRPWAIIFPVSLLTTSAVANAKFRPAFSHTAVIDNVSPALAAPMYLNEKKDGFQNHVPTPETTVEP